MRSKTGDGAGDLAKPNMVMEPVIFQILGGIVFHPWSVIPGAASGAAGESARDGEQGRHCDDTAEYHCFISPVRFDQPCR